MAKARQVDDDPNHYAEVCAIDFVQWLIKEGKLTTTSGPPYSRKQLRSLYIQSRAAYYAKLLTHG